MLGPQIYASLWFKSSWARQGILGSFGKVDAGFEGRLIFSLFNASPKSLTITSGEPIVQVVFERIWHKPSKIYPERSSIYYRQAGLYLHSNGSSEESSS